MLRHVSFTWMPCVLLVCNPGFAENAVPRMMSLQGARQLALARNWDLLAAKSDLDQAEAQRLIAKEFPNPSLNLSVSKINTDHTPNGTYLGNGFWDRGHDTNVAVSQLIELGGKRGLRQEAALRGMETARARFEDARRLLDNAIAKGYIAAVLTHENAASLAKASVSLKTTAGIAAKRFEAGDISASELKQVEGAAERFEADARGAELAALNARIALDILLGEKEPAGLWIPSEALKDLDGSIRNLEEASPQSRADVKAGEAAMKKAEADLAFQKSQRIPDLTFSFSYDHQPPDQRNSVGLGVGFNLPLWNRNHGAIAASGLARDQAVRDLARIQSRVASEQALARAGYRAAEERMTRYRDVILPKALSVRESVTFAYRQGAASLLELLEAERSANDVVLAAAQAQADALAATADLAAALNQPLFRE